MNERQVHGLYFGWLSTAVFLCGLFFAFPARALEDEIVVPIPGLDERFVQLEMVLIQPGAYYRGSFNWDFDAVENEKPVQVIYITEPFYMAKYEFTQAQWRALRGENPAFHAGADGGDKPVEMVSWNDVQALIGEMNQLGEGEFRLPTESEWEYACRAGTYTRFAHGHGFECAGNSCTPCDVHDPYMWYCGNNPPNDFGENFTTYGTKPVGLKLPNPWGLYDMHGNVWEWCSDWFANYDPNDIFSPQGPETGLYKVLRGGRWDATPNQCRAAYRNYTLPDFRHNSQGFRLCRTVAEPDLGPHITFEPAVLPNSVVPLPGLVEDATPFEFLLVPAGEFMMGSPHSERGRYADEAPHKVAITQPFWFGKYEVTQAQYEAVTGTNPSGFGPNPNLPVENLSWHDARAFVEALNGLGLGTFRLPTESEWEYACRAGKGTRYFFGDGLECADRGDAFCPTMDLYCWWRGNYQESLDAGFVGPREVGGKLPNPWGFHDILGNVWEWTQDWYGPYPEGEIALDPAGPANGTLKVLRGGMYRSHGRMTRAAFRDRTWPSFKFPRTGVRVVWVAE